MNAILSITQARHWERLGRGRREAWSAEFRHSQRRNGSRPLRVHAGLVADGLGGGSSSDGSYCYGRGRTAMSRNLNGFFAFPANTRPESIVKPSLIGAVRMAAFRGVEDVARLHLPPGQVCAVVREADHVQI